MEYKTIKNHGISEIDIKKSIFIGNAINVESENEAKKFIAEISTKHKDATHNCSAFIVKENMLVERYNDDGEPKGTAGLPILGSIQNQNIINTCVVVTRYFGGIMLGSSGLYRAYSSCATLAIQNALIVSKVLGNLVKITVDYKLSEKLKYFLECEEYYIEDKIYTDNVTYTIYIESKSVDSFLEKINDFTSSNVLFEVEDPLVLFKSDKRLLL